MVPIPNAGELSRDVASRKRQLLVMLLLFYAVVKLLFIPKVTMSEAPCRAQQ